MLQLYLVLRLEFGQKRTGHKGKVDTLDTFLDQPLCHRSKGDTDKERSYFEVGCELVEEC